MSRKPRNRAYVVRASGVIKAGKATGRGESTAGLGLMAEKWESNEHAKTSLSLLMPQTE